MFMIDQMATSIVKGITHGDKKKKKYDLISVSLRFTVHFSVFQLSVLV